MEATLEPTPTAPGHQANEALSTPARTTIALGLGVAALQALVVLPFLGRYGWDRDELYFLSAARRPTWGYVDFPPVTAWIAWLVHAVFGNSLNALRLTSLAAMCVTTVLVALMARELGGNVRSQAGAALVWALSPYGLSGASIFHPTWFDVLCWVALLYVVLLALRREEPRLWLVAGAVAGVGMETKYTIVVLLFTLLVALIATGDGRRVLRTRWPWLGLAVALALFVPNLIWEAQHAWPSIHFFSSQDAKTADDTPPATYLGQQLLIAGGFVLACVGVVSLWRTPRLRPLALVPPLVTLFFLLERGRGYYPLPADSIAVAAGAVVLGRRLAGVGWARRVGSIAPLVVIQVAVLVLALPLVVPVRDTSSMISSGAWKNSFFKDEIGWPELADETARAWSSLPPRERAGGVVLARNYGEASALELYGPSRGLPLVLSGHLSWQYWRPRSLPERFALLVGFDGESAHELCVRPRVLARIDNDWRLDNEERGRTITACRLKRPLGALWASEIATETL
jgi:hypothetical protein